MNFSFKQDERIGKLHTALGPDTIVLRRFDGVDGVNELFDYTIEALSLEPNINFDDLIGTHATVELSTMNHGPQYFDGIITEAQWAGFDENGNVYKFQLRPWLWLASRRRDQRIFHNKSVDQIIAEVFGEWGERCNALVTSRLTESYPELEYTVQYQESDLDFVRRLMEQFGISFHFVHEMGKHGVVLTDTMFEFDPLPGGAREFKASTGQNEGDEEYFWDWKPKRHLTTGAVRMTDYNFKKPAATMEVDHVGEATYAMGQIESYDYPGDYTEFEDGKTLSRLRTRQERSADHRHEAIGNTMSLMSGMKLELTGDHVDGVSGVEYVCLSARHSFKSESYGSGESSDDASYAGQYTFTPATAPFAPVRKTSSPRIYGPQTATVVGDGEIDCDEFGRILVHFPWDLQKAYSMRCRVAQISAHKGWGAMVIPRIGMEVVVEFLDGDPIKPLVTGCVYNGKNMPPYGLPGSKSQSGFLSTTHEGSGSNELRFEDQADKQEIYMHAEKDHNTVIGNNETHDIGVDRSKTVGNDQTETIGNDKTITVGNNHTETIGNNETKQVGSNLTQSVGANKTVTIGANHAHTIGAQQSVSVGKMSTETVGMMKVVTVGMMHQEAAGLVRTEQTGQIKNEIIGRSLSTIVGKKQSTNVGSEYILEAGSSILAKTKKHTLAAADKFVISGPGGSITIAPSGITIAAKSLKFKAPKIDFVSGSAQGDALMSDKSMSEECTN